ncbi:MAG: TIM-barrel domain-containing protein [Candidatus Acidiferrum sp.]
MTGPSIEAKPLPDGIEVRDGSRLLRIEALRNDVLRFRESPLGTLAEDASWAVLPEARTGSVNVTSESDDKTVGFRTSVLRVMIGRTTMATTVLDMSRNVLQSDEPYWPVDHHGSGYRAYKRMPPHEHYFGLGDKVGPLDRRGRAFSLWNTDFFGFQESDDPIYKAIPFFLTLNEGRSIGVLLDSTWRTTFDFGLDERKLYSFGADGGLPDYYVIYGPEPNKVIEKYAWLTGTAPLPPLWSLGYQQSRYSYEREARVREIAARLRKDKIPADAIYLDIDYQENHRPFTVDRNQFPHFEQMVSDLNKEGIHTVVITDLHIADFPSAGYEPYDSGIQGDHFVKNPDGSVYVGDVWPGRSVFPDFTRKATRDWWGSLYAKFVADGVSGFWNDMNEPSVFLTPSKTMPLDVQHRIEEPGFETRTANHAEIHNVFGMENSRATYDGLLKLQPNRRPFVLTRASYAGGQRYAYTWTGDNTASWNHLRMTTPMILNLGLSGFGLTGADVGGFVGTPRADLLTKWMEVATFQPVDRNHTNKGGGDREPWVYGSEQEAIQRKYIENRYRLLPYIYTAVEEMSRTGMPPARPLFLAFPEAVSNDAPLDVVAGNQFLFGPSLLVAPAPFPEQPDDYTALLPGPIWYDYWSGLLLQPETYDSKQGLQRVTIHPAFDTLPVYVRGGSIIPMQPLVQSTSERPAGPLTLRVYPGPDCHGSLYLDDGASLDYRNGSYLRLAFSCERSSNGWSVRIDPRQGSYTPWWKGVRITVFSWDADDATVAREGKPISGAKVDREHHSVTVEIDDDAKGGTFAFSATK